MLSACSQDDMTVSDIEIHKSGFEATDHESFTTGALIEQDGWFAYLDANEEAASVSNDMAKLGKNSLKIDGSKVKQHPYGVVGGFYGRKLNYDPLQSKTPIIELSADLNLLGDDVGNNQCDGGIALILDGDIYIGVGATADDVVRFFFANQNGVEAFGPIYQTGEWANIRAVFDFENKMVKGYINDEFIAQIPFTKNTPETVTAVGMMMVAGPNKENISPTDMTGVTSYVDNLTVSAHTRIK